jgi:hypothetical protein
MKKDFLVVYDYGMGGVWAVISARSQNEITEKYPMLSVQQIRPSWMTDEYYEKIKTARTFDIDDKPSGWLLSFKDST